VHARGHDGPLGRPSRVARGFKGVKNAHAAPSSTYVAGKSAHLAGIIARRNSLTIRLTAPAPDLLARVAEPAFCAVPSTTPIDPNGVRVIPSAARTASRIHPS
jgi:hypothetical protein